MLQTDSPKPLYEQIREYVLDHIHTGTWGHNTRIPSERDLAEQFEVSRVTVGKAIKELVRTGHLSVQIGKGTYVNEAPMKQQIETLTSFTEEMQIRGQQTTSQVLSAVVKVVAPDVAQVLHMPAGSHIMELQRVRYVNKRPMAIECASVVANLCPNILDHHDFTHESLYGVLRADYDVNLVAAEQTFEARAADDTEANYLQIVRGAPVLAIHRVTYDNMNRPCEEVKSVYRGDRYKFRAKLSRI
ncbi:MAG: GntR family transcriptional regulator [Phototrophicaceae bacterium]